MAEQTTDQAKTLTRYRLREGKHLEKDPTGVDRLYVRDQAFTSLSDNLHLRWPDRFERLGKVESFKVESPSEDPRKALERQRLEAEGKAKPPQNKQEYLDLLNKMTVEQLIAHAAEEEIDLKGAKDRPTVLKAIKSELS